VFRYIQQKGAQGLRTSKGLAVNDTLHEFALLRYADHAVRSDGWELYWDIW
jgi:hypothetical protein